MCVISEQNSIAFFKILFDLTLMIKAQLFLQCMEHTLKKKQHNL